MADKKISALPVTVTPAGTDEFPLNQGGTTKKMTRAQVHALESGEHLILPSVNEPATPTIAFGDGDSGFYESTDDNISIATGGIERFKWDFANNIYKSKDIQGAGMRNITSSATNPTLLPRNSDIDSGIGSTAADQLSLIAGGVQIAQAKEAVGANQFIIAPGVTQSATLTPSLAFGDGDSGFFEPIDDNIQVSLVGIARFFYELDAYNAVAGTGPAMKNLAAGAAIAGFVPRRSDPDTGIGSAGSDALSLVAGGIAGLELKELNSGVVQVPAADVTITAFATGGQGSAVALKQSYNVISVCATAGDSVKLPDIFGVNSIVYVKNDGAESCDIFPATGNDLGQGLNTAEALAAGVSAAYIATAQDATWTPLLAAAAAGAADPSLLSDGTALLPAYSFTSDPDTGIYLAAVNELGFSTGGVLKATLTAAGRLGIGTPIPSAPLEVVGDQPGIVGGFQAGAFQVRGDGTAQFSNAVITGHSSFNGNTQLWYIGSASSSNDDILILNRQNGSISFSSNNIARFVIQADGTVKIVNKIENAVGTAALPSYSFTDDPDLGIFRVSADRIGISSNGALRWDVSANFITTTLNTRGPDSTALLPTYSFASDPDTGVFNVSADILGLTAGGIQIAQAKEVVGANQFIIAPGVFQNNAAAPSLAFGNGDTGFFEFTDNVIDVSVAGTAKYRFSTVFSAVTAGFEMLPTAGSLTAPVYRFVGDTNTGIGHVSDALSLVAGGLECLNVREFGGARQVGFYGITPISLQTGVAVTAAGIHAALVALNLITA